METVQKEDYFSYNPEKLSTLELFEFFNQLNYGAKVTILSSKHLDDTITAPCNLLGDILKEEILLKKVEGIEALGKEEFRVYINYFTED